MHQPQYARLIDLPDYGIARLRAVCDATGLGRSTIYELIAAKKFPSPVKLTAHASGWRVSEIRAWLADPTSWHQANAA